MKLTRIDSDREIEQECRVIQLDINGTRLHLKQCDATGRLMVRSDSRDMSIQFGVSNVFYILPGEPD